MKGIATYLQKQYTKETYADLVNKVSKMIGKPYIVTYKMVVKFEPSQLDALYQDCLAKWRSRGFQSPSHMFFTERKKM